MSTNKSTLLLIAFLTLHPLAVAEARKPPPIPLQAALSGGCSLARGVAAEVPSDCLASPILRRPIVGDVVEYSFEVRTGAGPHDRIGIHRVVREAAPFVALRTHDAVLLVHGDIWGFDAAFLANLATPAADPHHALPVFLARQGVDVWGIDLGWTLVPGETTDFAFFEGWGMARDARDVGIALGVARGVRLASGNGFDRLDLLGWSRGGQTGYAYLNSETQMPPGLRQVKGFIPVDIYMKTDDPAQRLGSCAAFTDDQALLDAGTFQAAIGGLFSGLGDLALAAPAGPSDTLPGLTNLQAALFFGSALYNLIPPGQSPPFYHFVAGTFDAQGTPTGLVYTPQRAWLDFERGASPYEPTQLVADGDEVVCDQTAVPFANHLAEITVPVLYLGAGGGFGEFGIYSTTLLGTRDRDVTIHVVRFLPPTQRALDIGHVDIFNATDAPNLFWQPILDWITRH